MLQRVQFRLYLVESTQELNALILKIERQSHVNLNTYTADLRRVLNAAIVTDANFTTYDEKYAVNWLKSAAADTVSSGRKLIFIGNGGSSAVASHMATDWSKNGQMRSLSFDSAAMLTCLSNDYGYEAAYQKNIEYFAQEDDLLIAISSSGTSKNIINAVKEAKRQGCKIFSLSGFKDNNPLRRLGDCNLYLGSQSYGFVELGHLIFLHMVLDDIMADQATKGS